MKKRINVLLMLVSLFLLAADSDSFTIFLLTKAAGLGLGFYAGNNI